MSPLSKSPGNVMKLDNGRTRILTPQEKEFANKTFPGWQLHQGGATPENLQPLYCVRPRNSHERNLALELKPAGIRMRIAEVLAPKNVTEAAQDTFFEIFGTNDVREALSQFMDNPDAWLDAHMDFSGEKTPRELLGTPYESIVKSHLMHMALGIPT